MAGAGQDPAAAARDALERGEYLLAVELARTAVRAGDPDVTVRWLGVLALARAGSTERARRFFDEWGLRDAARAAPPELAEDLLALDASIAKGEALGPGHLPDPERSAEAAGRYERIWDQLGRPYSGVNAATLWLLAGDRSRAVRLARAVRAAVGDAVPPAPGAPARRPGPGAARDYWRLATLAECDLVEGRPDDARRHLAGAAASGATDLAARASTRRQLRLLCRHLGVGTEVVDALPVPGVLHYTGHMAGTPGARFPQDREAELRRAVEAALDADPVGFGYGSLAAGADVLIAEALLERGAELHVYLPCSLPAFVDASVAPAGPAWVARFDRCLAAAVSLTHSTGEPDATDPVLIGFNARVAMGSALLHAERLAADPWQLAIWDGGGAAAPAGTGREVALWRGAGLSTRVLGTSPSGEVAGGGAGPASARRVRSVLVGDFHGFGRLGDAGVRAFVEAVLGPVAGVLDRCGDGVLDRNTWGDGLIAFFASPTTAARCALDLQEAVSAVALAEAGLPSDLGLRLSLHVGPMVEVVDPVRARTSLQGAAVTRAARVEPATPEGEVYVTEPFAALLALEAPAGICTQYVGQEATAKGHGVLPLWLLRPTGSPSRGPATASRRTSAPA